MTRTRRKDPPAWLQPPVVTMCDGSAPLWVFDLPGLPPAVNNLYTTDWRTSRRVLSTEGRVYKARIAEELAYAVRLPVMPHRRTHVAALFFFHGMTYLRDVDGGVKILQDALATHLGINDAYFAWTYPARVLAAPGSPPHTTVHLFVLDPAVRAALDRARSAS